MTFASQDALLSAITAGQYRRLDHAKSTSPAHTATGGWHLLTGNAGYPNAGTFPGTDLLFESCNESTGDGTTVIGLQHGGPPGGVLTKHLINAGASIVAAAGAPWQLKLVDLLGYYRLSTTNVTGTSARTLINSNTFTAAAATDLITYTNDFNSGTVVQVSNSGGALPAGLSAATDYWLLRQSATTAKLCSSYANWLAGTAIDLTTDGTGTQTMTAKVGRYAGVGVEAAFVVVTQPTAGGPNLTASDYTNTAGTSGRSFQGTPGMGATADAYATRIIHSGQAAARYGAFLPKQGGDTGILRVNSFTWSGGTAYTGTGVVVLALMRPLGVDLPLAASGVWTERDLINQLPSAPKVEDGACLSWLLMSTGATTDLSPVTATLDVAWG